MRLAPLRSDPERSTCVRSIRRISASAKVEADRFEFLRLTRVSSAPRKSVRAGPLWSSVTALQPRVRQDRVPEAGAREVGQRDVRAGQVGAVEYRAAEVRLAQVGAPKVGAAEVRSAEVGVEQDGVRQLRAGEGVAGPLEQRRAGLPVPDADHGREREWLIGPGDAAGRPRAPRRAGPAPELEVLLQQHPPPNGEQIRPGAASPRAPGRRP